MPSPFPGMDPYLESPRFFPDLHAGLIFAMKENLQGRLTQAYYARSGQRVWLDVSQRYVEPDVNVMRERREIPHGGQGGIALAEPEVEIERAAGEPVLITVETVEHDDHLENYLEIHGRWSGEDHYLVYPIRLRQRLPVITVPLLREDAPVQLDLQAVFNRAYEAGPYRKTIWYGKDPIEPALQPEQTAWAVTVVNAFGVS